MPASHLCASVCMPAFYCVLPYTVYIHECVLVTAADVSIIHSLRDQFANDSKGRRVYGVTEGGSERRAEE